MSEDLREQNRNPLAHADGAQPGASAGASDAPASGRRRHLLKAAASAAPLIATLPNGAALANGSAFQCLEKDKTESDKGPGSLGGPNNLEPGGNWITVQVPYWEGTKTVGGESTLISVFKLELSGGTEWWEDAAPNDDSIAPVQLPGNFDPNNAAGYSLTQRADANVLVFFDPEPNELPYTALFDCTGTTQLPQELTDDEKRFCAYPRRLRDTNIGGLMGNNGSCMMSLMNNAAG
jgi:hypothetical protein